VGLVPAAWVGLYFCVLLCKGPCAFFVSKKKKKNRLRAPIALVYFSTSAIMAADSAAGSGRLVSMEILQTVVLQLVVICSVFALTCKSPLSQILTWVHLLQEDP
jgi:hypothetical protein